MIIDAHAHIGTAQRRYPVYIKTTEQIIEIMDRFKIEVACVSSLLAINYDFLSGNLEMRKEISSFPGRFIPFCVVHPRYRPDAIEELRRCVDEWGWKGLKLHPLHQGYPADCRRAQEIIMETARLGVPVLVHSSMDDFTHPRRIANLADKVPDATIIMGHMGALGYWYDSIEIAEQYENIILDTTNAYAVDGLVETAVEAVGADRIVWGTNLPLSYPGPNLVRITESDINEREKRQILGENILRILA